MGLGFFHIGGSQADLQIPQAPSRGGPSPTLGWDLRGFEDLGGALVCTKNSPIQSF